MKPTTSRLAAPTPVLPNGKSSTPNEPAASLVKKSAGGRPPKYSGPSRPITVTLPETTLRGLQHIHQDRGQAIVKLTEAAMRQTPAGPPMVEIVEMATNTGLLLVGPSEVLRRIPFLHLVEVAPARYLLALDPGNDFKTLELAIRDVLDEVPNEDERERELIGQLLEKISQVRRSESVSMAEILFVKLKEKGVAAVQSFTHTVAWFVASVA